MNILIQPIIVPYRLTLVLSTALGLHGRRSGSLSTNGAIAAAVLGYATLASPIKVFGVCLLCFYFAGSKITKIKAAYKATLEAPEDTPSSLTASATPPKPGGNRSAAQVACNALVGALCAISWRVLYSGELHTGKGSENVWAKNRWCVLSGERWSRPLVIGAVAFWSACSGDTLGILSKAQPRLITTLRAVPHGTNGAVSAWGTLMSLLGGLLVGVAAAVSISLEDTLCPRFEVFTTLLLVGGASGLIGSGIDSIAGATLQETLYSKKRLMVVHSRDEAEDDVHSIAGTAWLSNNGVNVLSSTLTAAGAFWWAASR